MLIQDPEKFTATVRTRKPGPAKDAEPGRRIADQLTLTSGARTTLVGGFVARLVAGFAPS
jgi:hypothetical protein